MAHIEFGCPVKSRRADKTEDMLKGRESWGKENAMVFRIQWSPEEGLEEQ